MPLPRSRPPVHNPDLNRPIFHNMNDFSNPINHFQNHHSHDFLNLTNQFQNHSHDFLNPRKRFQESIDGFLNPRNHFQDSAAPAPRPLKRRRSDDDWSDASITRLPEQHNYDSRILGSDRRTLENVDVVLVSRDEIERCSPSRKDGIDCVVERQLRYSYCLFIHNMGIQLQLPHSTVATAVVLCHRFFFRRSHACNDRFVTAKAFQAEGKVSLEPVAIDAPGGFLFEWWSVFWDIFIARTNESHSEVAASSIETQVIKVREQQQEQQQPPPPAQQQQQQPQQQHQQLMQQQLLLQRHAQQQQHQHQSQRREFSPTFRASQAQIA